MIMGPEQAMTFAHENGLAVFLITREENKFVASYSAAFEQYLPNYSQAARK